MPVVGNQPFLQQVLRHGAAQQVPLQVVACHLAEGLPLVLGLNPLSHHLEIEALGNTDNRLEQGLAVFKLPELMVTVDALPRNAMNKVSRRDLRETVIGMLA